jgi:hypothetical protein
MTTDLFGMRISKLMYEGKDLESNVYDNYIIYWNHSLIDCFDVSCILSCCLSVKLLPG